STEQYLAYNRGRDRLFRLFMEYASERTMLFVGYGLQDSDLRTLLNVVTSEQPTRPRYYLISPSVDPILTRHWERKRIAALAGTFDEALADFDARVPKTFRGLRRPAPTGSHPLSERIAVADAHFSENTLKALSLDFEYVKTATATGPVDAI